MPPLSITAWTMRMMPTHVSSLPRLDEVQMHWHYFRSVHVVVIHDDDDHHHTTTTTTITTINTTITT